ncbi:MAG TPA: arylsulfotransferase family protein [Sphingobium sp.]|uniref:arylsulfotransferase family protein n=1 Tax=Sphingobium sp. TaxID=1912891 RepID=UPI002ECFF435
MPVRPVLLFFRNAIALFCFLSVFAYAVQWSVRYPSGPLRKTILSVADAPRFVVETLANIFGDPFAASRTPDQFSANWSYQPIPNHTRHRIEGLVMRRGDSAEGPQPGWRMLYGIFQIDGEPQYAALALSPAFAVEHLWLVSRKDVGDTGLTFEQAPYPHGLALLSDGSIVAGFDTNYRTVRMAPCGGRMWLSDAYLNHAIYTVEGERFAWGVGNDDTITKVDLRTGKAVRIISAAEIAKANPDVTALDMLRIDDNGLGDNSRDFVEGYHSDPYHINDVEPLQPAMAASFPQFRAGDLLLSFRSLNMIAVVDPVSLHIKWFTNGYSFRQHDPDWNSNGEISVIDNEMGRDFSRIMSFDPATGGHRTLVAGKAFNFYTRIRGKHQSLDNGGMIITSSGQGRIFELGRDGRIASEILVMDPRNPGKNFVVSEATVFPSNDPIFGKVRTCTKP